MASLGEWGTESAIILGSGLSDVVENSIASIPYSDFPEIARPTVSGHRGQFSLYDFGACRFICAQGRLHLYEGRDAQEVTAIVRVLAAAGVKNLIVTNAAGALNQTFRPGGWMMITDHLNLTGASPLIGSANFQDLTAAYSPALQENYRAAARKLGLVLYEGVYAGVVGPQYETPAEVRMLHSLGADAVGMSTVLEVIQARALGMQVAGFSCLTNWAAGMSDAALNHDQVLASGKASAGELARLLAAQP